MLYTTGYELKQLPPMSALTTKKKNANRRQLNNTT